MSLILLNVDNSHEAAKIDIFRTNMLFKTYNVLNKDINVIFLFKHSTVIVLCTESPTIHFNNNDLRAMGLKQKLSF